MVQPERPATARRSRSSRESGSSASSRCPPKPGIATWRVVLQAPSRVGAPWAVGLWQPHARRKSRCCQTGADVMARTPSFTPAPCLPRTDGPPGRHVLALRHAMGDRRPTANAAARDPRPARSRTPWARAAKESRAAMDRWVDEGGRVPFEGRGRTARHAGNAVSRRADQLPSLPGRWGSPRAGRWRSRARLRRRPALPPARPLADVRGSPCAWARAVALAPHARRRGQARRLRHGIRSRCACAPGSRRRRN
jgi:hypothetical protein